MRRPDPPGKRRNGGQMGDRLQAARCYGSIFDDSAITTIGRYGAGAPKPEGSVLTVSFTLEGQSFTAGA